MEVEKLKTLVVKLSYKEMEQLALIGINAIVQTSNAFTSGQENEQRKTRYEAIAKSCNQLNINDYATIANIGLSDCDLIKLKMIDK